MTYKKKQKLITFYKGLTCISNKTKVMLIDNLTKTNINNSDEKIKVNKLLFK